jgi:hypothetical protein
MRSLQEIFEIVIAAVPLSVFFPGVLSSQPVTLVQDGLNRTYTIYVPPRPVEFNFSRHG